jgi:lipopolysaccharide transport system ATP-binding protein
VAAHLEPEVLIVDEVLSVGDAGFQQKCLGKMNEVARAGRTVLFVSHNMAAVSRLCTRAVWLDNGSIAKTGGPDEVLAAYLGSSGTSAISGERLWPDGFANPGVATFSLTGVRIANGDGPSTGHIDVRKPFTVDIQFRVLDRLRSCRVGILLRTADGTIVLDAYDTDDERYAGPREPGNYMSRCTLPGKLLSPGRYVISVNAGEPGSRNLAFAEAALNIEIVDTGAVGSHMRGGRSGIIRPEVQWEQDMRILNGATNG